MIYVVYFQCSSHHLLFPGMLDCEMQLSNLNSQLNQIAQTLTFTLPNPNGERSGLIQLYKYLISLFILLNLLQFCSQFCYLSCCKYCKLYKFETYTIKIKVSSFSGVACLNPGCFCNLLLQGDPRKITDVGDNDDSSSQVITSV